MPTKLDIAWTKQKAFQFKVSLKKGYLTAKITENLPKVFVLICEVNILRPNIFLLLILKS